MNDVFPVISWQKNLQETKNRTYLRSVKKLNTIAKKREPSKYSTM